MEGQVKRTLSLAPKRLSALPGFSSGCSLLVLPSPLVLHLKQCMQTMGLKKVNQALLRMAFLLGSNKGQK